MGAVQNKSDAANAELMQTNIPTLQLFFTNSNSNIGALSLHHLAVNGAVDDPKSAQTRKRACRVDAAMCCIVSNFGRGGRSRTCECRNQNPVP